MQFEYFCKLHFILLLCVWSSGFAQAADQQPDAKNAVSNASSLSGVGIAINPKKKALGYEVFKLVPNSPAALSCEIEPGDTMIGIGNSDTFPDDIDIRDFKFETVVSLVRGPVDSEVRLRIIPKSSLFVKEKVVSLKRRALFGENLIGKKPEMTLTSIEGRHPITIDQFENRAVVMILWSGKSADFLTHLKEKVRNISDCKSLQTEIELMAVNCDETIEEASESTQKFDVVGLRHFWVNPQSIESVSSGTLPLIIVVRPTGEVDAVCHPDAINLEKYLKRLSVETKSDK